MNVMRFIKSNNAKTYCFMGMFWGVAFYAILYSIKLLDPTYLDWVYCFPESDLFKQQIGFEFYLRSEWRFPIGTYEGYRYPCINTIIESDFLPLLGIFFKLFRSFLPEHFTYLGWWILLCMILQGIASALILRKLKINLIATFISLPLFFCNVVLFRRVYGHLMLCGHFLILFAILACLYERRLEKTSSATIIWLTINSLSICTHPYLFVMVGIIFVCYILYDYLNQRDIKRSILIFIPSVLSVVFIWYLLGGFIITSPGGGGLGLYSMNINALINPIRGSSTLLKEMPTINPDYQWEGECYLGIGIIILLIMLVPYWGKKTNTYIFKNRKHSKVAIWLFVIISTILALSPIVSLGDKVLFDYSVIPIVKILEPVRATGRFFWPVLYLIIISVIYRIYYSEEKVKKTYLIIAFASIMQFVDLSGMVSSQWRNAEFHYEESFFSKELDSLINDKARHLELIPTEGDPAYGDLALFADYHNMTMNIAYMTRSAGNPYVGNVIAQIEAGEYNNESVYCIPENFLSRIDICLDESVYMVKIGDYFVIYDKTLAKKEPDEEVVIQDRELKLLSATKTTIGSVVSLSDPEIRFSGVSFDSGDYSWTDGKEVVMKFVFIDNPEQMANQKIYGHIDLAGVYNESQCVNLGINGKMVYNGVVNQDDDIDFSFLMPEDGYIRIDISIPDAISPKERNESEDSRILGLALKSISFNLSE